MLLFEFQITYLVPILLKSFLEFLLNCQPSLRNRGNLHVLENCRYEFLKSLVLFNLFFALILLGDLHI